MSRLIDADELLKELESNKLQPTKDTNGFIDGWCEGFNTVVDMIRNQPTAFNMEKVVEQLEQYANGKVCDMHRYCPYIDNDNIACENCGALGAIDIVKKGGVE